MSIGVMDHGVIDKTGFSTKTVSFEFSYQLGCKREPSTYFPAICGNLLLQRRFIRDRIK
jgi:hypothetical protein